ncbi:MAG: pantoate--beta-alanine ligase [bacterium]
MKVVKRKSEMRELAAGWRAAARRLGLVPTMGALHEGHLSLVRAATGECDATVVSIFVNPTQFAPGEDFQEYPRTIEADTTACAQLGVDAVFAPSADEMYAPEAETYVGQDRLTKILEGAARPTHFRGVLTVVLKLFNIVAPDAAYFGRKDYQQTVVLRRMVADLDVPVDIRVCATVREPDGLAMSSRNSYLGPDQRRQATCLYDALCRAEQLFEEGERDVGELQRAMRERLAAEPDVRVEYAAIADAADLAPPDRAHAGDVALVAARVGGTRLIDNIVLGEAK